MYVYVSSDCSSDYFEGNTNSKFTSLLPQKLELEGDWEVALLQIQYSSSNKSIRINVQTDVISDVIFENNMLPILRQINLSSKGKFTTVNYPFYLPVRKHHVDKISIHIVNQEEETHSFANSKPVRCTLHFRKCRK